MEFTLLAIGVGVGVGVGDAAVPPGAGIETTHMMCRQSKHKEGSDISAIASS